MDIFSLNDKVRETRGATLLELLVYAALLAALTVVVAQAFLSLAKARGQSEARSEVNAAIRFAVELIRQDLKGASVLTMPALGTPSSVLTATVSGAAVTYDVVSGQLQRNGEAITGALISVDTPSFVRLENYNATIPTMALASTTSVKIFMTFRYNASSSDWTYADTLRTTVTLR
jgi:type II secretory pathway pseudopilin PulG